MKRSYLDYAMSVIVSRALPDVRDGLKPVHRRILHSMHENGYDWNKPYRKSARVVGDVMGKYHPHGDAAIYDAMVRMAQDFSMRLPLLDGQGNYGSMDGDPPAAMRYTEVRLGEPAHALLTDIDKETVDFQANYDESAHEPVVLPAAFPNLLVNGAGGIAVGMATNIPPHNLGEVVDAACAYLDDPEITIDALMEHVPGPDFPTGATIMGAAGIRQAYHFGRGSVVMRGLTKIEQAGKDREAIIVTEIPYQVNKARMIERIAGLVNERRIEGIADLRDESDRDGVRVVIELKRSAMAEVVLNQLYRYSPLQTSFGVNMLALRGGKPEQLTLKDIIAAFIDFREEVVTRRTAYQLRQARTRAHALAGLAIAVANIDEIIALIRKAKDPAEARAGLTGRDWPVKDAGPLIALIADPRQQVTEADTCRLTEEQARAILELRLQRLTAMERDKIADELAGIVEQIKDYIDILQNRERLRSVLRSELVETREKFADARRTKLGEVEFEHDVEDLIQREEMVVTLSHRGYVKRVPLSTYRAQKRGGKGRAGMSTRDEDFVSQVFVVNTHTPVLFFSTAGKVYKLKVYRLPQAAPQARGKALVNLLPLAAGETISTILPMPEDEDEWARLQLMFATAAGSVRAQQRERLRERPLRRQDRHEARRGRPHRRRADLRRQRRRASGGTRRQVHPLRRHRRPPVPGAQLVGRARDGPRQGRPGDLHERAGARRSLRRGEGRLFPPQARGGGAKACERAPRRARRPGAVPADGPQRRLRQAHVQPRLSPDPAGRQGYHQHGHRLRRDRGRRRLPRGREGRDHARDRRRPADPLPGEGHQADGQRHARRDHLPLGQRRAGGLGGAARRCQRQRRGPRGVD